jgi:hypothetical protein
MSMCLVGWDLTPATFEWAKIVHALQEATTVIDNDLPTPGITEYYIRNKYDNVLRSNI